MINRSDIDIVGASTGGENVGTGVGVFKTKDTTGNTLQFRTITGSGGITVTTGQTGNTIIISGGTGSFPVLTGMTNYLLKVNSLGNNVEASSIYDSGSTNITIEKNTVYIGDYTGSTCITIKPTNPRKIELIASSGVNVGSLDACLCISCTTDGLTLCSAAYQDLLLHAGSCSVSGCAGKTLRLSGGDGVASAAGGGVILSGGTASGAFCGGGVVIAGGYGSSGYGRVQMPTLPSKSTETCAVYIDLNGNLSKGTVSTGNTTIVGGTQNVIPKFNSAGNNIQNSSLTINSNVLCNNGDLTIEVPNTNYIYLEAPNTTAGLCYGNVLLGKPTTSSLITAQRLCTTGAATNVDMYLIPKGSGQIYALASTVNLSNSGTFGFSFTSASRTFQMPTCGKICGYGGGAGTSYCDATPMCIIGGFGTSYTGWAGSGGTILICGGCACSAAGVGVPKVGGSVVLKAGPGICGGADGRIKLCGLPLKAAETCGIYIDGSGNLSYGIISGGSGGGSVGVTGATNGVCLYNSKNVCLGGILGTSILLTASGAVNGLQVCTTNTCTALFSVNNGCVAACGNVPSTSWSSCIGIGGCMNLTSYDGICSNTIQIRPGGMFITQSGGAGNTGLQYSVCDYTKFTNPRAIPDVGWVKSYALAGWSNLVCGSTVAGFGTMASGVTKNNTYYGVNAGTNTTACNNTGVGTLTLNNNTTGCWNTALGYNTLAANLSGCYNTGIGANVLISNAIGNCNVALGMNALHGNLDGSSNVAIGLNALYSNVNGNDNTAVGFCALAASTTSNNVAIGACALVLSTSSYNNIAIGTCALRTLTIASNNIGIGNQVLQANTSGSENVAIGLCAMWCNTTGIANTAIGVKTLAKNTIGSNNVAIGCYAMCCNTGGTGNIAIGYQALLANRGGGNNIVFGGNALYNNTSGSNSIAIGVGALQSNTIGNTNIGIGGSALQNNTTGMCNIAIGYAALQGATSHSGANNIVIGRLTMQANTTGSNNVVMGLGSMSLNTTGNVNTAIGEQTLYYNTTGYGNVGVGCGAGFRNSTGNNNVYVGLGAGYCNTGTEVTAVGTNAGYGATGYATSRGVFIGRYAGCNETGTDKLHIANCGSCTLICGDFVNKSVTIDGCLCITKLPAKTSETNVLYIDSVGKISSGATSGGGGLDAYAALTSGATVTWNTAGGLNKTLNISTSFTLTLSGLANGMSGDLRLNNTTATSITITFGNSNVKLNGSVTSIPAGVYHLTWVFDGTNLDYSIAQYI